MYSPIIDGHHPNWTLLSFTNKTFLHGHRRSTVNAASCHSLYESNHTRTETPSAELQSYLKLDATRRDVFLFTNRTLLYGFRRSTFKCRNTAIDCRILHNMSAEPWLQVVTLNNSGLPVLFRARKYPDKTRNEHPLGIFERRYHLNSLSGLLKPKLTECTLHLSVLLSIVSYFCSFL